MEAAARALAGQIDPIELGQQLIDARTFAQRLEEAKKASYAQGKKDFEQESANKKQETMPVLNAVPKFNMPVTANGGRLSIDSFRTKAAEDIVKKFGPQWFSGR